MYRIAIVEDNANLRQSLQERLLNGKYQVIFSSFNGADFHQKLSVLEKDSLPELILMDIEMPVMNGIEATRKLNILHNEIKVIMLTVFEDEDKIFEAILSGAQGYLLKDEPDKVLFQAIDEVMNGGASMTPRIALKAMNMLKRSGPEDTMVQQNLLSVRELEILKMISEGISYPIIAERSFISLNTVKKHVSNIFEKLQVNNKVAATKIARDNRWFSMLF